MMSQRCLGFLILWLFEAASWQEEEVEVGYTGTPFLSHLTFEICHREQAFLRMGTRLAARRLISILIFSIFLSGSGYKLWLHSDVFSMV
jgi:hypothetical protein